MGKLPTLAPTRAFLLPSSSSAATAIPRCALQQQVRHATFIPRPRRPFIFTQLITLSDGSAYTMRTTSPLPIYRATKDTRNTLLWQPSEKSLKNVELDEAGRLAAFRERYGRAYDAATPEGEDGGDGAVEDQGYADLISGYATESSSMKDSGPKKAAKKRK